MAFQILNKENKALTLKELNALAAEFWDVEHTERYVVPKGYHACDWFNFIGAVTSDMPKGKIEWSDLIGKICGIAAIGESYFTDMMDSINCSKPYIELCFQWKRLGYTPVSC